MLVCDVMTGLVATALSDDLAEQAYATMHVHGVHHLVVAREGDLLGVISDRDLGGAHGAEVRKGRRVRDLMVSNPICGTALMTLGDAAALMRRHTIGCLPIIDGGKLVGIVTVSDMLGAIEQSGSDESDSSSDRTETETTSGHRRDLRVFDLMRQPAEITDPAASIRNAASQMAERGIGFLPVCENGGAVGVLTDRDITVRAVALGLDPSSTPVNEVMTRRVQSCLPEAPLSEARRIMRANVIRRLVVADPAGRVVGVLSIDDLHALPPAQASRLT